jgi:hypothetical protein
VSDGAGLRFADVRARGRAPLQVFPGIERLSTLIAP